MRLLDLLIEANIPDTEYGYWITHHGEYLEVPYESHAMVAHRYFQRHPEEITTPGITGYEQAYRLGWIRIIDRNGVSIAVRDPKTCTAEALRAVLPYIHQIHDDNQIAFDVRFAYDQPKFKRRHYPTKQELTKYFMRFLLGKRRPQMVAENHDWSPYGYWIDAQGKVHAVAHEQHERDARKAFGIPMEKLTDGTGVAKRSGWIRVIDNGHEFDVELDPRYATKDALKSLLALIKNAETNNCYLETGKAGGEMTRQKLTQAIRALLKGQITEEEIPFTSYGYWITAEGKFIPVRGQFHQVVSDQYFPKGEGLNRIVRAYKAGWIRVVTEPRYLDFDLNPRSVRKLALYGVLKLIKQSDPWPEPIRVTFDLLGATPPTHRFDGEAEANAFVRDLMKLRPEARV